MKAIWKVIELLLGGLVAGIAGGLAVYFIGSHNMNRAITVGIIIMIIDIVYMAFKDSSKSDIPEESEKKNDE